MRQNQNRWKIAFAQATLFLVLAAGTGCSFKNPEGISSSASISPDDSLICYVNAKGENNSIYIVNRVGVKVGEIPVPNDEEPFNPVFSPDRKEILYLSGPKKSPNPESAIYLNDVKGPHFKRLTLDKEFITEAVFSPDGKTIYFLSAGSYGHYSHVAQSHPHDFDVYSVDVTGNNPRQWTQLKAYGLSNLAVSSDGSQLFFVQDGQDRSLVSLSVDGKAEPVTVMRDVWNAKVSPDNKVIIFSQMKSGLGGLKYDLFRRDLRDQTVSGIKQLTFLNSRAFGIQFFNQRPYVLFVQQTNWPNTSSPELQLKEINLDGSDLKQILLPK